MEYLPWYVVYGHFLGVMIPVLFAIALVGYVLSRSSEEGRSPGRFVKAAVVGAVAGFLLTTVVGSLSYTEATHSSRATTGTSADCLDKLTPAYVASISLWHRSDALSRIRWSIERHCRGSRQTVEMRAATIELDRGGESCDNLAYLFKRYLWLSRLEQTLDKCGDGLSYRAQMKSRLTLGDFEGASKLAEVVEEENEEMEKAGFRRHARIHVVARRYARAQASLERAIEEIEQLSYGDQREHRQRDLPYLRCALEALKVKQGDEEAMGRLREEGQIPPKELEPGRVINCGRVFADLVESDEVGDLLAVAYEGLRIAPSANLGEPIWGVPMVERHDVFYEGLLEDLRPREDLTDEVCWHRANLLISRAVFDLRLDRLEEAGRDLDAARVDIDYLMEEEVFDEARVLRQLHLQSFRIDQLSSVVALRSGDVDGAMNYLESAVERASSPYLTTDIDAPYFLEFGTAQFKKYLEMMESGQFEDAREVVDWMLVGFQGDDLEELFTILVGDDGEKIIESLERWDLFGSRPGVLAIIEPFLSDHVVEEVGRYERWNVDLRTTHIYSRTIYYALEDLRLAYRMAKVMGQRELVDELAPVLERYHEVYFDLDTYRLLILLEGGPSNRRVFRWSAE